MAQKMSMESMEERQKAHEARFREMEEQRMMKNEHLRDIERDLKEMENSLKILKKELGEELVKDGYIEKNDKVQTMKWDNDEFEVNGKKIKESDHKKYKTIFDKYSNKRDGLRKLE
jgi:hypothetical protein